jgi:acyl-coenzyme A synthetase/AMP-(fatty) acid ligase
MQGYWQAPAASAARFSGLTDGSGPTLRTGDLGHLDARGRLSFVGRRDDIFKRRSVRMSTVEVEAAALDIHGVCAAAVLPPDEGDALTVYVVGDVDPARVLAGMTARVDPARVPDRCVVLSSLPTTASGKIDKAALRHAVGRRR